MFVSEVFDEASEILGTTDQSKVFRVLTQAVQALMESGHWLNSQKEVDVCTGWDGQTITLPKDVEIPLAIQVDGTPVYFRSKYFEYHVNRGGTFDNVNWAWDDKGLVATIEDIRQPSQLVAVAEHDNDAGKQLRVVGTDRYNRPLRTQLADGTLLDGKMVTVHSQKDFAYGTITPDGADIETRTAAVAPLSALSSGDTTHGLTTGEPMVFSVGSTLPAELSIENTYYVGVVDPYTIQLYPSSFDAENGSNAYQYASIPSGSNTLSDIRPTAIESVVQLSSAPGGTVPAGTEITFSGANLPNQLTAGLTYFVAPSDQALQFFVYASLQNAQNGINPLRLSFPVGVSQGSTFTASLRKPISPQTTFVFSQVHYFVTGDVVQVGTNGGTLSQPLLLGVSYYVNKIDNKTITLHTNLSDANLGINPIVMTTLGQGIQFVAKLIPATATAGTVANINVTNLNIPATQQPTTTATAIAIVTGPITAATASGGTGYTTTPPTATVWDAGGAGYTGSTFTSSAITSSSAANASAFAVSSGGILSGGKDATFSCTVTNGYVSQVSVTSGGSGYEVGDVIYLYQPNNSSGQGAVIQVSSVSGTGAIATGTATSVSSAGAITAGAGITLTSVGSGASLTISNNATSGTLNGAIITTAGSGYMIQPRVALSGGNGTGGTASTTLTPSFVSSYLIKNPGKGYAATPGITVSFRGDGTASAVATISGVDGSLNSILPVAQGSGYTSAPPVTVVPSSGAFVTFSSAGTLPTPLVSGISYRAENVTSSGFTVKGTDFSKINITDTGSGGFYVELSNAFSVGYNNVWSGDFSGVAAGTLINFGTDYQLPQTIPAISPNTSYYISPSSNTSAYIYTNQAEAQTATYDPEQSYSAGSYVYYQGSTWRAVSNVPAGTSPLAPPTTPATLVVTTTQLQTICFYGDYAVSSISPASGGRGTGYSPSTNYPILFSGATVDNTPCAVVNPPVQPPGAAEAYATTDASGAVSSVTVTKAGAYLANTLTATVNPSVYWTPVSGGLPSLITLVKLGVGQSYFSTPDTGASAVPVPNGIVIPSTLSYLSDKTKVTFTTTGSYPSGISEGATYLLQGAKNGFSLNDTSGNPVTISGVGAGQLTMTIARSFNFSPSTYIIADSSLLETGDAVYPRPATGDILPPSLASLPGSATDPTKGTYSPATPGWPSDGSAAYARRLDENYFELYSTKSQALNLGSTAGRLSYTKVGNTASSTFLLDSSSYPTLVKSIAHVDKPASDGYISLYAWDYGRSNDMTLIGQYHPNEINPRYRRIRIGKPCAWVRILYRAKCPTISSVYDYIPLEQTRAIINATHAIDLENKDFFEQAEKYWAKAYRYLANQQEVLDGHAMTPIQVNGVTYGDKTDDVMF